MRILAVSDIHNRIECVHELRRREANDYAAIVVAGDIGAEKAGDIFEVLCTFECPVGFIRGNWDYRLPLNADFGPGVHHLAQGPMHIGGWHIAGFDYPMGSDHPDNTRNAMANALAGLQASRTIVVSHDRPTRTSDDMRGVALFLYGHLHHFEDKRYRGSRFVNVSALGEVTTVAPRYGASSTEYRNAVRGSYVAIHLATDGSIQIQPKRFRQLAIDWEPLDSVWPAVPVLDITAHPFSDD